MNSGGCLPSCFGEVNTVLIKSNENEIRKISSKISEKRRKTAKFRLSSNFRTYVSEISLRHCLVRLRNFGVAAKLRSKCRPKFRYRAIFRKKFWWALRNVARNLLIRRYFARGVKTFAWNFDEISRRTKDEILRISFSLLLISTVSTATHRHRGE